VLFGGNEVRHGTIEIQLDRLAFAARRSYCGLDRLADNERIASWLSYVSGYEDRSMVLDTNTHRRLDQHPVS
jgi:hypothetical protein